MNSINKLVKRDMKHLNNWLSEIKFHWMLKKQNIFKSPREVLSDEIKIKLSRKRLSNLVKYLGVRIDKVLIWHDQVNNIAVKLNRAYPMLLETRNYIKMKALRNTCIAIFDSLFLNCLDSKYKYSWCIDYSSEESTMIDEFQRSVISLKLTFVYHQYFKIWRRKYIRKYSYSLGNQLTGKCLPYFMIDLNFEETCIDMKLPGP